MFGYSRIKPYFRNMCVCVCVSDSLIDKIKRDVKSRCIIEHLEMKSSICIWDKQNVPKA